MVSDFTKWIQDFIQPGDTQAIVPGRHVHLGVNTNPVKMYAQQAVEMAVRLMECSGLSVRDILFVDGREPSRNERHLINLISWRQEESRQNKEEIAILREQLNAAAERAEALEEDRHRQGHEGRHERVGLPLERLGWLLRCEKALRAMAEQIISPKTTAEDMVSDILQDAPKEKRACR